MHIRIHTYVHRIEFSPAGTAVRFEPGERKTVSLVTIAGNKVIRGGNNLVNGPVTDDPAGTADLLKRLVEKGFAHKTTDVMPPTKRRKLGQGLGSGLVLPDKDTSVEFFSTPYAVPRELYARMYGPTTGDIGK